MCPAQGLDFWPQHVPGDGQQPPPPLEAVPLQHVSLPVLQQSPAQHSSPFWQACKQSDRFANSADDACATTPLQFAFGAPRAMRR